MSALQLIGLAALWALVCAGGVCLAVAIFDAAERSDGRADR